MRVLLIMSVIFSDSHSKLIFAIGECATEDVVIVW